MASAGKEEMELLLAQFTHLKNVLWYFLTEAGARSCKINPGRVEANSLNSLSGWFLNFQANFCYLGKYNKQKAPSGFLKLKCD